MRSAVFAFAAALLLLLVALGSALADRAPQGAAPLRRTGGREPPRERPPPADKPEAASGAPRPALRWPEPACLPKALVADAQRFVQAMPGFGPVRAEDWPALAAEAARLSAAHSVRFGASELAALRRLEVAQAVRRAGVRAQRFGPELAGAAARGAKILDLAARRRLPPLAVVRQVLIEGGLDAAAVRAALRDPARLPPEPRQLRLELPGVLEADQGSPQNEARIRAASQAFEDAVGAELRRLGCAFRTEAALREEGAELTPDFLLTPPATINGREVAWVDAKNQPAVDHPIVRKGLKRAAERYTARFGPGAFVFNGGVSCEPAPLFSGVLLLDGSHLQGQSPAD